MADKTYQSGKEKVKQYVSALESKAFFVAALHANVSQNTQSSLQASLTDARRFSDMLPYKKHHVCTLKTAYIKHLKYVKRRDRDETRRCESNEVEKQQTNKPSDINAIISERPSKKERRADALALRADERRDKLR